MKSHSLSIIIIALIAVGLTAAAPVAQAAVVEGLVYDAQTREPIPHVTIRVLDTDRSSLANDDGRYRVRLDPGEYRLRFSHIAHYSAEYTIVVGDEDVTFDVSLAPSLIELPGTRVYTRHYDPAQVIIVEAIRHKEMLLNQIQTYEFEGYTRLTARKIEADTLAEFLLITETQLEGYFRQPDEYKEIITARRQSSNLNANANLVTIGDIFNFNDNRIHFARQSIVSPTATDALDHYNYYLLDTIMFGERPVFKLEVEPKSNTDPLVQGTILIIDSTFAVVGVDVEFNEAVDLPYVSNLTYQQRFDRFDQDIWMPVEISLGGRLRLPIPVFPHLKFSYIGALNRLVINDTLPDGTFDEYIIEVAEGADKVDSLSWDTGALVPLTKAELQGYEHIDSIENRPPSIPRLVLTTIFGALYIVESPTMYDFAHFNRVEGPYLGAGWTFRDLVPRSSLYLKQGYAFDGEYWQHHYRLRSMLHRGSRFHLELGYKDEIVSRPAIFVDRNINPTLVSLLSKMNPLDYYLEKGFDIGASVGALPKTRLDMTYHDYLQISTPNHTNYGLLDNGDHRPNPAIHNGHLRSLSAAFTWDSHPLILSKGREDTLRALPHTQVILGFETADPGLIDNDFDYRRYHVSLIRTQRLRGWGTTTIFGFAGSSDGALPPQRHFTVDFGDPDNIGLAHFKTLDETNFAGDRAAAWYLAQDFGSSLFRKFHVPLLKKLPFSVVAFGGMFWSDFRQTSLHTAGESHRAAIKPYSEIGFGIGRLPPGFLRLDFTWQLSDYTTSDFAVSCVLGI